MMKTFTAIAVTSVLAGCDGTNPFMVEVTSPDGETELIDANDPNTDVNSQFAYDPTRNLTMNSVEYDATNDQLIINNLPFDGPDGVYDDVAGARTVNASGQVTDIFENTEAVINGEMQYYAVFVQSDYLDATSAAGREWANFGFAGANLNRTEYATPTPSQSSYEYLGVYAATRTYNFRGGIELIRGDARLLLDVDDTDPLEGLQGTVVGAITNRTRDTIGDTMVGDLPDISLISVEFNTETGLWEDGTAATYFDDGNVRDTGTHTGLIGGPDAEELGGYVILEGVADVQTVTFEIVEYTNTDGSTGTATGQQFADFDAIQAAVNAGIPVGTLSVGGNLPTGATIDSTSFDTFDVNTTFDAREIGVFVTDLN
ncbi:hypothetical protein SAMN05444287_0644 [Octadecabacter temperatus]|uniref:Uncharacterized protein n=1 Tax=Octadecabacter temperatus TaxID=1458307 RepID=A0A0K0Y3K1_9RHOB|nr:hypothetical protein [Octadecabacter temperatus]AKS45548.1 hypothetical protein OSB_09900 [Octadecabacter temperatus]SIN95419.1 hypothetical protein SAMN05444287_0644 [Octadecabacter temperatus]